jgi:hypothetical protein
LLLLGIWSGYILNLWRWSLLYLHIGVSDRIEHQSYLLVRLLIMMNLRC